MEAAWELKPKIEALLIAAGCAVTLEVLAIVALKQPVAIGDINAIRGIESASTVETLAERGLIARSARLGIRRARLWRTTQVFLESSAWGRLTNYVKKGGWRRSSPPCTAAKWVSLAKSVSEPVSSFICLLLILL